MVGRSGEEGAAESPMQVGGELAEHDVPLTSIRPVLLAAVEGGIVPIVEVFGRLATAAHIARKSGRPPAESVAIQTLFSVPCKARERCVRMEVGLST